MNTEDFIKRAKEIHNDFYDYSKSNYTKIKHNIAIICPIHGEFKQVAESHLTGSGCKLCGQERSNNAKRLSHKEVIKRFQLAHGKYYDYSKVVYKNKITDVEIICPIHGSFYQLPVNHWSGHGCSKCGGSHPLNKKIFIEKSKEIHRNKFDYSKIEYINARTKVIIICNVCKEEFEQMPYSHMAGIGCPYCAGKHINTEQFIKRANKIHNKYDYSQSLYKTAKEKIIIICPTHGEFKQTPDNHLSGCGCPKCSNNISHKCQKWLKLFNDIDPEHEIKINGKRYVVDGFNEKTNTVFEFYGDKWHGNKKIYDPNDINPVNKKTYGELYEKTMEKEKDLMSAGYNLITIWESDYDALVKIWDKNKKKQL